MTRLRSPGVALSVGVMKDFDMRRGVLRLFRRVCDLLLRKGVKLTSRIVPRGEHNEASWEKQIPFFLPVLLYEVE